jgi:hypothetical protein
VFTRLRPQYREFVAIADALVNQAGPLIQADALDSRPARPWQVLKGGARPLADSCVEILRASANRNDSLRPDWLSAEDAQHLLHRLLAQVAKEKQQPRERSRAARKHRIEFRRLVKSQYSGPLLSSIQRRLDPSRLLAATPSKNRPEVLALMLAAAPQVIEAFPKRMAAILLNGGPESAVLLAYLLTVNRDVSNRTQLAPDPLLTKAVNLVLCVALTQEMGVPVQLPWLLGSRGSEVSRTATLAARLGVAQGQGLAQPGFSLANVTAAAELLRMLPPAFRGRAMGELGLAPGLLIQLRSLWKALEDSARDLDARLEAYFSLPVYLGMPFPGVSDASPDTLLPQIVPAAKQLLTDLARGVSVSPAASALLLHVLYSAVPLVRTGNSSPATEALAALVPDLVGGLRGFAFALNRDAEDSKLQQTRVGNLSLLLGLLRSLRDNPSVQSERAELWAGLRQLLAFYARREFVGNADLQILSDCLGLMDGPKDVWVPEQASWPKPEFEGLRTKLYAQFVALNNEEPLKYEMASWMATSLLPLAMQQEESRFQTAVLSTVYAMVSEFFSVDSVWEHWHSGATIALAALERLPVRLHEDAHACFNGAIMGRLSADQDFAPLALDPRPNKPGKGRLRLPISVERFLTFLKPDVPSETDVSNPS